jgi:hypothetical protein
MRDDRHPTYSGEAFQNVQTSHEKSDVDVRALMWFVVIFVVFGFVTHLFLWLLFKFYVRLERHPSQNAPALTAMQRPAEAAPVEPRLQPFPSKDKSGNVQPPTALTPAADMERMIADTNAVLNNYGWVDQQKGIVHIPIEEAKKKVLGQLNVATGFSPSQNGPKPVPTSGGAQP